MPGCLLGVLFLYPGSSATHQYILYTNSLGCTDSLKAPPTHRHHTHSRAHTPPRACHTRHHLLKTSIVCLQGHSEAALCEQTGCSASSEEGGAVGCSAFPHACQPNHVTSSTSCNHSNELWTSLHLMGLGKKE